jgi:2-polyprenyl-3-methyl-5-hydroxy-6-metoxy-1,4-benzoquinol methylase
MIEKRLPPDSGRPDPASESPERFDPDVDSGKLVHAEHLARYLWAAELAPGRTVLDAGCGTGYGTEILAKSSAERVVAIDLSDVAVSETARRVGNLADVSQADVCQLPFANETFELVVCFEVIEHIQDASRAVEELARVLRPDGVVLVSSPNPRRYPPGNPYHVHEFTPEELRSLLERHFDSVALAGQHAWLGSLIANDDELRSLAESPHHVISQVIKRHEPLPEAAYILAAARHRGAELPDVRIVAGEPFEVKWWIEQVENAGTDARRQQAMLAASLHGMEVTLRAAEKRIVDLEQDYARVVANLDECRSVAEKVTEQRQEITVLRERVQRADGVVLSLQDSISWKVTWPLRWIKQVAQRVSRRMH